jgi:predicted Rossmann fold nucleotide-binding protein DprA/Smf involved in DNA uptake
MMPDPPLLSMLGEASLWDLPKTAFLSSDKFSAGSVLKSYDWAGEIKRSGRCVISGFMSKLEKDVLEILLNGDSPLIWALARGMFDSAPVKLRGHVAAGRLLIVSMFDGAIGRPNRKLAFERNQFIVDNADEVVFAHIHAGGMLERLTITGSAVVRVLG